MKQVAESEKHILKLRRDPVCRDGEAHLRLRASGRRYGNAGGTSRSQPAIRLPAPRSRSPRSQEESHRRVIQMFSQTPVEALEAAEDANELKKNSGANSGKRGEAKRKMDDGGRGREAFCKSADRLEPPATSPRIAGGQLKRHKARSTRVAPDLRGPASSRRSRRQEAFNPVFERQELLQRPFNQGCGGGPTARRRCSRASSRLGVTRPLRRNPWVSEQNRQANRDPVASTPPKPSPRRPPGVPAFPRTRSCSPNCETRSLWSNAFNVY